MSRTALAFVVAVAAAVPAIAVAPVGVVALDRLQAKDVPVVMSFENRNLSEVIQAIGSAAGFEATFADGFKDRKVTLGGREKMSVKELLTELAKVQGLTYEVPAGKRLVVKDGR